MYIYIYSILEQPGLTLEREARLIVESIYYDKELEGRLVINATIDKTGLTTRFDLESICLCVCTSILDIGFAVA